MLFSQMEVQPDAGQESQLRECHSSPRSSCREIVELPAFPSLNEPQKEVSKQSCKTVRFALRSKTIQYFNPAERPSLVQKSMSGSLCCFLC
ncbi:hypothetical protein BDW74DRAFT_149027 [Aspergillus multicolor]|uniref:uncharacterized protein n=1 Tax=Aspergillus multicolor TaxID=41759 RepID=UPI003CCD63F4